MCLAALALAGCHPPLTPSKPLSELNAQELRGHQVYQAECARCHHANSQSGLRGPGLEGVFRKKYLPSGLPANDHNVEQSVLYGRDMMPSFENDLSQQQLNDLMAYLHTL
jgi:mono/diheme cytochrome c family protein